MKRLFLFFLLGVLGGFIGYGNKQSTPAKSFTTGEELEYRVHYGFITAGEAIISINHKVYNVNGRPCYKINIFGKSTSAFDLMLRIRDNWGTYLDTSYLIPHQAYRLIEEGKYRKNEVINFDHKAKSAEVKVVDRKTKKFKEPKYFKIPYGVQDLVSGYYYLRNIDYNKLKVGEIISINAFFEDTLYDFRVRYLGKESVHTKVGQMKSIKLSPIMPENQLFEGENSIRVWLSDDPNKIPLKIQADLFVGAVEIDIKRYSGLRY